MFKDILIQFTLSEPVFRVFGEYLECFKYFNNANTLKASLLYPILVIYPVHLMLLGYLIIVPNNSFYTEGSVTILNIFLSFTVSGC